MAVLWIDNSPHEFKSIRRLFHREGASLEYAYDLIQAIEYMRDEGRGTPDLIILDVLLPFGRVSSPELAQRLDVELEGNEAAQALLAKSMNGGIVPLLFTELRSRMVVFSVLGQDKLSEAGFPTDLAGFFEKTVFAKQRDGFAAVARGVLGVGEND